MICVSAVTAAAKVDFMFKMLIDTCVWLDLAKDQKQVPLVGVVEEMIKLDLVSMIVPRVVLDEFRRNRERIAKESAKSLSSHFRLVKDTVGKIGGDKRRMNLVLAHLDDVDHKIPIVGGTVVNPWIGFRRFSNPRKSSNHLNLSASELLSGHSKGRLRSIEKKTQWRTR